MKKIPGRPNIFDLATKELTMDAMIAWFLDSSNSKNKSYKTMSDDFINTFIFGKEANDTKLLYCKVQYNRMDVFAVIRHSNVIHPVIFENKTNTSLHGGEHGKQGQLVRYCKNVFDWVEIEKHMLNPKTRKHKDASHNPVLRGITDKIVSSNKEYTWGELYYIYFKIGFIHSADTIEFENQRDQLLKYGKYQKAIEFTPIRTIDDMHGFLMRHNARMTDDLLFKDYNTHIKSEYNRMKKSMVHWNDTGEKRSESLKQYPGQWEVLKTAFGDDVKAIPGIPYGNRETLEHEIAVEKLLKGTRGHVTEKKRIKYIFTFKYLKRDGELWPVVSFQQYRDDPSKKPPTQDRLDEYEIIYQKSKKVIDKLRTKPKYTKLNKDNLLKMEYRDDWSKSLDAKEIFSIWFYGDVKSERIASFMRDFKERLVEQ